MVSVHPYTRKTMRMHQSAHELQLERLPAEVSAGRARHDVPLLRSAVGVLIHGARTQILQVDPLYLNRVPWSIWKTTGTKDVSQ